MKTPYNPTSATLCPSGNVSPDLDGLCVNERCQACCAHDERDHGICLDCEHEADAGEAIDCAMDYYGGER